MWVEKEVRKAEATQLQTQSDREKCDMHMHEATKTSQQHSLRKSTLDYRLTCMGSENSSSVAPLHPSSKVMLGLVYSWICLWVH